MEPVPVILMLIVSITMAHIHACAEMGSCETVRLAWVSVNVHIRQLLSSVHFIHDTSVHT